MMAGPGRKRDVTDEEILAVFQNADDPVLTTREVSEAIGLKMRGTYDRLMELREQEELERKKIGEVGAVWWHPASLMEFYNEE